MREARAALLSAALLVVGPGVDAGDFYVGASVGRASLEADLQDLLETAVDSEDAGYKIFGGYRFFRLLGLEGGYVDFGSVDESFFGLQFEAETSGWDVFAVGVLPTSRRFELFGKAGLVRWVGEASASNGVDTLSRSDAGWDFAYGFGAAMIFRKIAVRFEWESFEIAEADRLQLLSVGLDVRF